MTIRPMGDQSVFGHRQLSQPLMQGYSFCTTIALACIGSRTKIDGYLTDTEWQSANKAVNRSRR